jgi:4-diphosphocytidyl-2-C-methyl-D-erythritol kinase
MQMVSLFDTISIQLFPGEKELKLKGSFPFAETENTIWRAYQGFRRRLDFNCRMEVCVQKCIPYGAGLGGGSSDAASFIRCLNLLHRNPLNESALREIGLEIGSDVPFFLGSTAAFVTGRGERIVPLQARTDFRIVLVYPGFPIETRRAYEWLDQREEGKRLISASSTKAQSSGISSAEYNGEDVARWCLINSFEEVIFARFPLLKEIQSHLRELGGLHCGISGSGSTVMGIFPVDAMIDDVVQALSSHYALAVAVEPLESKPDPVLK